MKDSILNSTNTTDIYQSIKDRFRSCLTKHNYLCFEFGRAEIGQLITEVERVLRLNEELTVAIDRHRDNDIWAARRIQELEADIQRLKDAVTKGSFEVGYQSALIDQESDRLVQWVIEQLSKERKVVALISPTETHDGPRYAGYYCEDYPG